MSEEEKIKEYAIFPGQIKVDNEVFFGIDYKITDLFNQISEENKKQKEVLDKIKEYIKENNNYLLSAKNMYLECDDELLKITVLQLINNNLVQNNKIIKLLEEIE